MARVGSLIGTRAESGRPLVVLDTAAAGFPLEEYGLDGGIESLILAPFSTGKKISGACLFGRRTRRFTDLDVAQLTSVADYVAQVAENAVANAALLAGRDAEYQALQSQVQPHFMYNVLNGLVALNRMGERDTIETSLHALKDILRYTLGRQRWTTVAEEFAFLERYCGLQKLRFEEKFSYAFTIGDGSGDFRIPKLIVQPLVENAVIHGVEPSDGPAGLAVSSSVLGDAFSIAVSDDGAGCDPSLIAEKGRIGIGNVRERLRLGYRGASLELSGERGGGFRAEIRIPIEEVAKA
jgi:LytS/YehU family sensor histidine kinase